MKLLIPIFINCFLVLGFYMLDKYTPAKKLPYLAKQIIVGIVFGALSAFASSYGVDLLGTVVNVRDAAPLSAGRTAISLVFYKSTVADTKFC